MSPEILQDAIGNIDDRFIDEADSEAVLPPRVWLPAASLAAVFTSNLFIFCFSCPKYPLKI